MEQDGKSTSEEKNMKIFLEESVQCDASKCRVILYDEFIKLSWEKKNDTNEEKIAWDDVLKIENIENKEKEKEGSFNLHYIKNLHQVASDSKGIRWKHEQKKLSGSVQMLSNEMSKMFSQRVTGRPSRLLVLINPRSGNWKAESIYSKTVEPLMTLAEIKIDRKVLEGLEDTRKFLNEYDLTSIDGIVAMGGDGTMADLINTMILRRQREAINNVDNRDVTLKPLDIKLGILPAGSGQCDTLVLNGSADAETSALHIIKGVTINGDVISCHNGDRWVYSGIVGGGVGYFADLLVYSEAKRWLGLWRYMVAFAQALWYLNTFEAEVEILKEKEKGEDEWEKLDGRFLEVGISPRGIGHGSGFPGFMEVIVQREAPRGQVAKYVGKFMNADQALFEFPHVTAFRAKEIRIRLPHIEEKRAELTDTAPPAVGSAVHVDGELFNITHPQLTFRLHKQVVNFFGIERDASEILHK